MDNQVYQELLAAGEMPYHIQRHCAAVAKKADALAADLAACGIVLNREKLRVAALVHDVCREQKDHAAAGAVWAVQRGCPEIGKIIACHHWLSETQEKMISEETVLYLADKLVKEDCEVSLEERFSASLGKCRTEIAQQAHKLRYEQAKRVEQLIMSAITKPGAYNIENNQERVTA